MTSNHEETVLLDSSSVAQKRDLQTGTEAASGSFK